MSRRKLQSYSLKAFGVKIPAPFTSKLASACSVGKLISHLRHLGAVGQLRRDTPFPPTLWQRFHCHPQLVRISAGNHGTATPSKHLLRRSQTNTATTTDNDDLTTLGVFTQISPSPLNEGFVLLAVIGVP
jgi:hypothetical protein